MLSTQCLQDRRGVKHFRVDGKRYRERYLPALQHIRDSLRAADHGGAPGAHFRPVKNPPGNTLDKLPTLSATYRNIVRHHAARAGVNIARICTHALRAAAAINTLDNSAGGQIARAGVNCVRYRLGERSCDHLLIGWS